jgi:REP-associated tyrosine transposase
MCGESKEKCSRGAIAAAEMKRTKHSRPWLYPLRRYEESDTGEGACATHFSPGESYLANRQTEMKHGKDVRTAQRDVAQPPSAVDGKTQRFAQETKHFHRRNLPHFQSKGKTFFITFSTWKRWQLPESVRSSVIRHCLHDHGIKHHVHGVVVMPDHVHMVLTPKLDQLGKPFGLHEIMNGIKGASAHSINKSLGRKERVWQDESFDHILRSDESMFSKVMYICNNPVKRGLLRTWMNIPGFGENGLKASKMLRKMKNDAAPF